MATYHISTLLGLQAMSADLAGDYILDNDIDASDTEEWNLSGSEYLGFEPIGASGAEFTGSFDGGNFTISGLYINRKTTDYIGLFGAVQYAANLITNGTFTGSATGWTLGTGWAYSSNTVLKNADGDGTLSQTLAIQAGSKYVLTYTVSARTVGSVTPSCGGVTLSTRSANGTYTEEFTAVSTADLVFTPTTTARFTIDNVICYRVWSIKNVNITDAKMTGQSYVSILAGSALGPTGYKANYVVDNCSVSGTVTHEQSSVSSGSGLGGLMGNVQSNLTIQNCDSTVNIVNNFVVSGTGLFCGLINSSVDILNCSSSGSIIAESIYGGGCYLGGFVGYVQGTGNTITNCTSQGTIIFQSDDTTGGTGTGALGGFAGTVGASASCTFTLCSSYGNIIHTGMQHNVYVGGFCGLRGTFVTCGTSVSVECPHVSETSASGSYAGGFIGGTGTCTDCYAWGDVCSLGTILNKVYKGGFTGSMSTNHTRCYSNGFVFDEFGRSGGFVGLRSSGTCSGCFWDTDVSEHTRAAGTGVSTGITGGTTAQMTTSAFYTGYNFTTTWEMGASVTPDFKGSNITLWLSKTGDYDNFEAGVNDDDSFSFDVPTQNEIRWLGALESLLLGTAGDEWKIGSNKLDTPLTPTNFTIKQQSEYGSNQVQPKKINASLLFVDYVSRKVREMTYVDPKYESPDLTALAEHITKSGITSVARQKNPDSILWFTLGDGSLIGMTYEREQNVLAWAKYPVGGDPFVQCVCVIPGTTEDIIYLSCYRDLSGDTVYYDGEAVTHEGETVTAGIGEVVYMEKMAPRVFDNIEDAFFVDCGVTITNSPASATLTGLSHLNGETVKILGDGVVMDDAVVEDGQVTCKLDGVDTAVTTAQVGLASTYKAQPMRIVTEGSMGSITRVNKLVLSFVNTLGAKYGITDSELFGIDFSDIRWTNNTLITGLFTGEVVVEMPGNFDPLNPIIISGNDPLPCTLRCIIPEIDTTGR